MIWEYHEEGPEIPLDRRNELGAQGWEAYGIDDYGRHQFKRRVSHAAAALRSPTMALTPGPPPAYFENCVAYVDANGHPQWVTLANPLPTV